MAQHAKESKTRKRFLPFAYDRTGLRLSIERCTLDDTGEAAIDPNRNIVDIDHALPWTQARVTVSCSLGDGVLARVFTEDERAAPPMEAWLTLCSRETNLRRGIRLAHPRNATTVTETFSLLRDELFGTVELTPFLVRASARRVASPGYANEEGARVASGSPWHLRVDRKRPPPGKFLDVRYRNFSEDAVLESRSDCLYALEHECPEPILWLNSDHPKLAATLNDRGTRGRKARIRDVLFDAVSHGVWTQLFMKAATDFADHDELVYAWEDSVFRELLPAMYLARTHTMRLEKLRERLEYGGLATILSDLDAALQSHLKTTSHMTALVEEILERG